MKTQILFNKKKEQEVKKVAEISRKSNGIIFLLSFLFFVCSFSNTLAFNFEGDGVRIISPLESNGAIPVNIQDQHTEIVDLYLTKVNAETNPTSPVYTHGNNITVDNISGAVQYEAINIIEGGHYYQALILNISGDTITVNVPFDYNFTTNAIVEFADWNMNIDGSSSMIAYRICANEGAIWDITRIIFSIQDDAAMDSTTFGGLPSLTKGIVLRTRNDEIKNIFSINDNGGFAERAYDTEYDDRRSPLGEYGFRCRKTFAGQDKNGVTIRLDGNSGDCLEILIQDDLTELTKFASVAQGHYVTD